MELIITTDIGPRIIRFGYINGQNMFYVSPSDKGKTGGDQWRIYGGHRLWLSPEESPRSYYPDNNKVEYSWDGETLTLSQEEETSAGGGSAILPQEPYIDPEEFLLPARPLVLWYYTRMNDPRWVWGEKYIQMNYDPAIKSEQKIGILNKQGWAAYHLNGELFIKIFDYNEDAIYPDYGCNNVLYINGDFVEVESLGPLVKIQAQGMVEHTEYWSLNKVLIQKGEDSIDKNILPLVKVDK